MRLAVVLTICLVLFLKCKQSCGQSFFNKNFKHAIGSIPARQINAVNDEYYDEEESYEFQQSLTEQNTDQDQNIKKKVPNGQNEQDNEVLIVQPITSLSQSDNKETIQFPQRPKDETPQQEIKPSANENNAEAEEDQEQEQEEESDEDDEEVGEKEDADVADDNDEDEEFIDEEHLLIFQRNGFWRNLFKIL